MSIQSDIKLMENELISRATYAEICSKDPVVWTWLVSDGNAKLTTPDYLVDREITREFMDYFQNTYGMDYRLVVKYYKCRTMSTESKIYDFFIVREVLKLTNTNSEYFNGLHKDDLSVWMKKFLVPGNIAMMMKIIYCRNNDYLFTDFIVPDTSLYELANLMDKRGIIGGN